MSEETTHSPLDEADVALLDALHTNPRASFERLAATLGVAPITAARRWRRLHESGRAWVSSVPGPHLALTGAVCEIAPQPGRALEVGRALATVPQVASVYLTSGEFAVRAIVFAADMPTLSTLLLEVLPAVPGAARARSHIGTDWLSGVRWRLGALSSTQRTSVTGAEAGAEPGRERERPEAERTRSFEPRERALYLALQQDGRAGYRELGRKLGLPEHQARRQTESLLRRGMLAFRTDFARREGGWPVELVLWLAVAHDEIEQVGAHLAGWPETRIAMATTGRADMLLMTQLHRLDDLARIRARLHEAHPGVVVLDESVVLRALKSWGRLLDPAGRAEGVVPVDPWAAPDVVFQL